MRLLDTVSGVFINVNDPKDVEYAILSHTWDPQGEQTLQQLLEIQKDFASQVKVLSHAPITSVASPTATAVESVSQRIDALENPSHETTSPLSATPELSTQTVTCIATIWDHPLLSEKVRRACAIAREYGFRLIWIDSCCIDKTSSSELSEAINSMFAWYRDASVCFAFLADVPSGEDPRSPSSHFRTSRWFTRGWTLQELIAPSAVIFLCNEWRFFGRRSSLADVVEEVTHIGRPILMQTIKLGDVSVATRMSWAARPVTTRVEDEAYSLLGIFDINMPTLYGEGRRAFHRLQEEILRRIPDQSLFAWGEPYLDHLPSPSDTTTSLAFVCVTHVNSNPALFADAPLSFDKSSTIRAVDHATFTERLGIPDLALPKYTTTPYGIRTRLPLIPIERCLPAHCLHGFFYKSSLAILACEPVNQKGHLLAVVCTVEQSGSTFNLTKVSQIGISDLKVVGSPPLLSRLISLSPAHLASCRTYLHTEMLYVVTSNPGPGPPVTSHMEQVCLSEWSATILRAQGYRISYEEHEPCRKTLLLSRSRCSIVVRFGPAWNEQNEVEPVYLSVPVWISHTPSCTPEDRTNFDPSSFPSLTLSRYSTQDREEFVFEDSPGHRTIMRFTLTDSRKLGLVYMDLELED